MSADTLKIEIIDEIINASLSDEIFNIEINGGGNGIGSAASVEELNRYAYNIAFNAFRLSQLMNSMFFQMEDGILDFFTDENYVDLVNSQNQVYVNYFGTAFYYRPELVGYVPQDMVLRSIGLDSNGISGGARICILEEDVEAIILNTDLKAFVSRDNGTTFTQVILTKEGNQLNNFNVLVGDVDLSSQPEDLHLVWKLESYAKNLKIHGVGLNWL
jgi:hypothetical protein